MRRETFFQIFFDKSHKSIFVDQKILLLIKRLPQLIIVAFALIIILPKTAFAEKGLTLSASTVNVEVDKVIEVPVKIDMSNDHVHAIGFKVEFPTENLEGIEPSMVGTLFNGPPVNNTATRIDYGCVTGTKPNPGCSGKGLVTTLRFRGRVAGTATIRISDIKAIYIGTVLSGYEANSIDLTIFGVGQAPVEEVVKPPVKTITIPETSSSATSSIPFATPQTSINPAQSSASFGSIAQVAGLKGAGPEDPLKTAEASTAEASVKGMFSKSSILWTSILPTVILLAVIIFLGIKLYLNEKKRHAKMEKMLEKQLGTLSALQSKVDLVGEGGDAGKQKYLEEFEQAKQEVSSAAAEDKRHIKAKTDQSAAPAT